MPQRKPADVPKKPFDGASFFPHSTWVTSFSAFNKDDPSDLGNWIVPRLSTFTFVPTPVFTPGATPVGSGEEPELTYVPESSSIGYVPTSTILCIRFSDDLQHISGYAKTNRGGFIAESDLTGVFTFQEDEALRIIKGGFSTVYPADQPGRDINQNYHFIVTNWDEIEWLWMTSVVQSKPFRANVARGTLKRVPDLVGPSGAVG